MTEKTHTENLANTKDLGSPTEPCEPSGVVHLMNFPVFMVDQLVKNPPSMKETPVQFLGQEDPLEKGRGDRLPTPVFLGFPGGSTGKESDCSAGDLGLIPVLGRSPGEGNGSTPVFWPGEFHRLYSTWGCKESDMTE